MQAISSTLRVIWACMKKDIKSALSERLFTSVSIVIPLNVLLLLSLMVISGGLAPTAVVMHDHGPLAQQLYTAMSHAHSFVLQQTSEAEAHALIEESKVVAVVTIPADFDQRLQQNRPVQVDVQINNLNTDFTNDIRRALPLSITSFYAKAFPHLVTIMPHEVDSYRQDTDYLPYLMVSMLVMGLMIGGLVQAGTATAVEWERETAKELLLAPASRPAMLLGKMLGAFVVSFASATLVLLVLTFVVGVWPVHWGEVMGFTLLVLAIFIAWGTLLGTLLKQRMPVATLAMGASVLLFFSERPLWTDFLLCAHRAGDSPPLSRLLRYRGAPARVP
jgi:ABC-2 type transport system permease protein